MQLSNTVTLDNYIVTSPTTVNCSTKRGLCKETRAGSLILAQSSTPRMDTFARCQHSSLTTVRVAFTKKNVCPPVTTDISLNTVDICRFAIVQHGHVGPLHGHIHEVRCLINDDKIGQRRIGKHPRQDWTVDQSSVTIPPSWPQQDRYTRFSDEHKKWLISYGQSILQCLLQCRSISRA